MERKNIRIAFDAKRITHNGTGLGNYGRTLVNNLVKYGPDWEYLLYSPDPGNDKFREQIVCSDKVRFVYPAQKKGGDI
ncbi:MAG: hypothetical protein LUD15_14900 [Bacteroides sp.]|nr:hypothetical protein [Bacteroides sp.]